MDTACICIDVDSNECIHGDHAEDVQESEEIERDVCILAYTHKHTRIYIHTLVYSYILYHVYINIPVSIHIYTQPHTFMFICRLCISIYFYSTGTDLFYSFFF